MLHIILVTLLKVFSKFYNLNILINVEQGRAPAAS